MRHTDQDGVYIYSIDKSMFFDEMTATTVLREVDGLLNVRGCRRLVVDLTRVKMAGTPAVSLLIRLKARCDQLDREFGLCGLQPTFQEVLHIMNLDQFFQIYENAEQAVTALAAKQTSIA